MDNEKTLRSVALQNAASIFTARQRAEQRSETYLAEAQRLSHTGSFGWKPSSGELVWSEETFRIFQYDLATKPTVDLVLERVHPEDAALVRETIERAAQKGRDLDFEHRLLMPDGSVRHIHVVARASRDESGAFEFAGAVMDVSEQHESRSALERALGEVKKSERQLQLAIDTIPAMVWSIWPEGEADFVNRPTLAYLGYTREDLHLGWPTMFHPDDVPRLEEWGTAMATGKPFELEFRLRRADGAYRSFLIRAAPLRDEQGNIARWYGTSIDIEDRKRAETLLAGEKRILEMIARGQSLAATLDALCRLDEELTANSLSWILLLDPETRQLHHGAAPNVPGPYCKAIDGITIGPSVGSCGTAAYRAEPVLVDDIATDPLWADFRDLALAHGLRACWSMPILSSAGRVLGTFATYHREPRRPTAEERSAMERFTQIASIALERAQGEELLRHQARLLDLTHDTVFVRDMNDVITYWNRGAEELYGWSKTEAVGKVTHQLLQTVFPEPVERITEVLLRTGRWEGELVQTKRDGTPVTVASRWALRQDDEGRAVAILETNNDVTARKAAEEGVRRQADLLEQTHDAILVWEWPGATIVYWNRGAERLYGYSRSEAIGRNRRGLLRPEPPLPPERVEASIEDDGTWTGELTHRTRDGRKVVVDSRHVLVRHAAGGRLVLETNRDITEQTVASQALGHAQAQLAHVTRISTLGEVTATLAHEVNQPLAAIVNNANASLGLLPDRRELDEVREALADIVRDGERASAVIERVRGLARRSTPQQVPLRLADVVADVLALAASESAARKVVIRTDLGADLPLVRGDRVQLQQVLLNLIVNGMDAMSAVAEEDRILEIRGRAEAKDGSRAAVLSVQDRGVGIEAGQVDSIFEAFYTTKPHGMGMGLAISRSIIEAHGGELWAQCNEGPGTTFSCRLPAAAAQTGP